MEVILNSKKKALSQSSASRYVHLVFAIFPEEKLAKKETKPKEISAFLIKKTFVLYKFSHRILFMFLMWVKNFALCFLAFCSLRKQPFPLALRRWERFARKVPNGEGRGETAFFAGYRFSGLEFRLKEVVCVCLRFSYTRRDIFILAEI